MWREGDLSQGLWLRYGVWHGWLTKPISCIASSIVIPPQTDQNPTIEPHTTLPSARLTNESCRAIVSIDTTTSVDRHPRVSQTEDSAHSLQPKPLEDLCDKFSSISSPSLSMITSLDYSKTASQDNKPRVPSAAPTRFVYTPPWKARRQEQSSTTPPTSWTPPSQAIDSKQALSGRQPTGLIFLFPFFYFLLYLIYFSRFF